MNGNLNLRDVIIFISHSPVFVKRLRSGKSSFDTLLILAGFVNNLKGFEPLLQAQQFIDNNEIIQGLHFTTTRVHFIFNDSHSIIAFFDLHPTEADMEVLKEIDVRFNEDYAEIMKNWKKDLNVFIPFQKVCDEILSKYM